MMAKAVVVQNVNEANTQWSISSLSTVESFGHFASMDVFNIQLLIRSEFPKKCNLHKAPLAVEMSLKFLVVYPHPPSIHPPQLLTNTKKCF